MRHSSYLLMLDTSCLDKLFSYKMPMHRKYVTLNCVFHMLYDALFVLQYFVPHLKIRSNRIKNGSNNDRAVAWCHAIKSCQRIGLVKYYTLYGCVWYLFCRARHISMFGGLCWSIRRRNPPCNVEDNLCAGLIVIEAWFRGYWGSPGLGGPRTARLCAYAGLLDYEDTRLKTSSCVRMGLTFSWKASLAIRMLDLLLCNRLCVNLASSGVYINRRV